jgi:hyperosmotically inducible protein
VATEHQSANAKRKRIQTMKHALRATFIVMFGCLLTCASLMPGAQDSSTTAPAPDNTKVNQRDRNKSAPTADQQKANKADQETTRQIRQAVMQDKSLSTYAHNVKIITQNGMVTLKGPVRSDQERSAIEAKADDIAGKDNVTNQLEVKPKQ